jgi:hypothetical protein
LQSYLLYPYCCSSSSKLSSSGEPFSNPTLCRSLIGALQYLTITRPEISFAIQQACLYMHDRIPHYNHVNRILCYLKDTLDHGLHIKFSSPNFLTAYSDADWAGCPDTRRSTSGFCVFLGPLKDRLRSLVCQLRLSIESWHTLLLKRSGYASSSQSSTGLLNKRLLFIVTTYQLFTCQEIHCNISGPNTLR